jgi:arylformamidase
MSGRMIDVTVPIDGGTPIWEGDPTFSIERVSRISEGANANVSKLCCGVHTGTHVDAPVHFIDGAGGIETIDVDALVGPAVVVDARSVEGDIDAADLERIGLPQSERVLFRTRNSELWDGRPFTKDFVAIAPDAAQVLVDRGVRLVGVDYLSVGSPETHRILLGARMVALEGVDLRDVEPGAYELFCGPIKLVGSDGAPARVLLRSIS